MKIYFTCMLTLSYDPFRNDNLLKQNRKVDSKKYD